jgi:hypothetical protein
LQVCCCAQCEIEYAANQDRLLETSHERVRQAYGSCSSKLSFEDC